MPFDLDYSNPDSLSGQIFLSVLMCTCYNVRPKDVNV